MAAPGLGWVRPSVTPSPRGANPPPASGPGGPLLVAQGLDRVHVGRAPGRVEAEHDADARGDREGEQGRHRRHDRAHLGEVLDEQRDVEVLVVASLVRAAIRPTRGRVPGGELLEELLVLLGTQLDAATRRRNTSNATMAMMTTPMSNCW